MKELIREVQNRPKEAAIMSSVFFVAIAAGVLMSPKERPEFDASDYKYKISIEASHEVERGWFIDMLTNDEPKLGVDGGMTHLSATNVYCPREFNLVNGAPHAIYGRSALHKDYLDQLGCNGQLTPEVQISTPNQVIVVKQ